MHLPTAAKRDKTILKCLKSQILSLSLVWMITLIANKKSGLHSQRDSQTEVGNAAPVPTTTSRVERHARDATRSSMLTVIPLGDQSTFSDPMKKSKFNSNSKMTREDKRKLRREPP